MMKIRKLLHNIKNLEALFNIISLIVIVLIQEKTEEPLRTVFIIEWCLVIIFMTLKDYRLKMELECEQEKNKSGKMPWLDQVITCAADTGFVMSMPKGFCLK